MDEAEEQLIRLDERYRVATERLEAYHVRLHTVENETGTNTVSLQIVKDDLIFIKTFINGDGNGNKGARINLDRLVRDMETRQTRDSQNRVWLMTLTASFIMFVVQYFWR